MTALEKYTRLEAVGIWKETPSHDPVEVLVSFGDATLLLTNFQEQPLTHWALAATSCVQSSGETAIYTPDTEGFETLEINDPQMVRAIAQVSRAEVLIRQKPRVLRMLAIGTLLALFAYAIYAAPSALRAQAIRMTSADSARNLGGGMLATLDLQVCNQTRGKDAQKILMDRAFPNDEARLVIADNTADGAVFPGGILVVGNTLLQTMQSPEQLVVWMQFMMQSKANEQAVNRLFEGSEFKSLLSYVTSGQLPDKRLANAATEAMTHAMTAISLPVSTQSRPILRDQDWVALQGICLN